MKALFVLLLFLLTHGSLMAARPLSPEEEVRWHRLTENFRCPTCQSGSIADSPVGLAEDLRQEIRTQIVQGKSDAEIRDFMVARFGDFITYQPPLSPVTVLLWLLPPAFMLMALAGLWWFLRGRHAAEKENEA